MALTVTAFDLEYLLKRGHRLSFCFQYFGRKLCPCHSDQSHLAFLMESLMFKRRRCGDERQQCKIDVEVTAAAQDRLDCVQRSIEQLGKAFSLMTDWTTRRHGVLVVTNHRKRGWTHPATRQRLTFEQMITYLNGVAAKIKRNKIGEIEVMVIGIDAVKKHRSRARKNRKETAVYKKMKDKLVKRPAKSTRRIGR
jgi:hypothetical protein